MKCPKCNKEGERVFVPRRISKEETFYCLTCESYYDRNGMYNEWKPSQINTKESKK